MASAIGPSSVYCLGTPFACYSGTTSPRFNCTSTRVLRRGALVLGGRATRALSSSDHSYITALCVRVGHCQARCRLACRELHPLSSSFSELAHPP